MSGNWTKGKTPISVINEIKAEWKSGGTIGFVAEKVGVGRGMVRKYGKHGGIPR